MPMPMVEGTANPSVPPKARKNAEKAPAVAMRLATFSGFGAFTGRLVISAGGAGGVAMTAGILRSYRLLIGA